MKVSTVLKRALTQIKKGWCQRFYATNEHGVNVDNRSTDAVKHCSLGAMFYAVKDDPNISFDLACEILRKVVRKNVVIWNDDPKTTQEKVIKAFEKAIKRAEKAEKK